MSILSRSRRRDPALLVAAAMVASTFVLTAAATPSDAGDGWQMAEPRLTTPWTDQVSPSNALPEYPRPQLTRPSWQNLNGLWQFAGAEAGEAPPIGEDLAERILVPYPTESALSGIARHEDRMWYRRTFTVPESWQVGHGQRLRLHFGAVDHAATVWVNGIEVADHTGGYARFSADVTDALAPSGPQEIVVGVEDRTDATWQPVGKQRLVPDRGIFYTGSSGIWQTVWMEPVPARGYVADLDMATDVDTSTLALTVDTVGDAPGLTVRAVVRNGQEEVARAEGAPGQRLDVRVSDAELWSPDHPFLYGLDVTVLDGQQEVDHVGSYFGMREIGTARDADGRLRITLNHELRFLMATLDQGYWPDGIYTAPTDEALRFDVAEAKRLGFDTIRKHVKVEPDRWYHAADTLGMLVWQDMPSMRTGGIPPPDARAEFERQLHEIVDEHDSWTSVIGWVPFNEGWGEWDREATGRIADSVAAQDPTRLVNANSGVNCCASHGDSGRGDVIAWHAYTGPADPAPDDHRVAIDGEHGGFGLEAPGHMWYEDGHGYQMAQDGAELTGLYVENQRRLIPIAHQRGISGAVYTQITDVEHEVNGFLTYDRRVGKMDADQVRAVNDEVVRAVDRPAVLSTITRPDP
ncbi:glycoside hydrolase family 2 protein [Geodermatophilus sp. URMC 61]|uniref:glycoside hydrolase family 2 protein n=1 Tax=Geodermatophilus sp. URMC 61 TaxID=3423411 RepID=UPI00406C3513